MAIKGRTRRRARGGGAGAPKPAVRPRPVPLWRRRGVRWATAGLLLVAAALGGLRVWQNTSRASALRAYDEALQRAQGSLLQHFAPEALTSILDTPDRFTGGEVPPGEMRDLARRWESDFATARDRVRELEPPAELATAQELIAEGIDMYVGVARLYAAAAERALAAGELDAVALDYAAQASAWTERADRVYTLGARAINDLKIAWGLETFDPFAELDADLGDIDELLETPFPASP